MSKIIKVFTFALMFGLIFSAPIQSKAQSADLLANQISELLKQISDLQSRINALRTSQSEKVGEIAEIISNLELGSRGDQVVILQTLLSLDSDVYPEGLITGFFGPLTENAVKRFQAKKNIIASGDRSTTGYGFVGPRTRLVLKMELDKALIVKEDVSFDPKDPVDTDADIVKVGDGKKRLCLPPGHLIAPGLIRKGVPNLPSCKNPLPPGIDRLITRGGPGGRGGTTTQDTIPPVISNLMAKNIATTSATISWQTNEPATGSVWYATSSPVSMTAMSKSSSALVLDHSFDLIDLSASTTYYYFVASSDVSGNKATSSEQSFITLP